MKTSDYCIRHNSPFPHWIDDGSTIYQFPNMHKFYSISNLLLFDYSWANKKLYLLPYLCKNYLYTIGQIILPFSFSYFFFCFFFFLLLLHLTYVLIFVSFSIKVWDVCSWIFYTHFGIYALWMRCLVYFLIDFVYWSFIYHPCWISLIP